MDSKTEGNSTDYLKEQKSNCCKDRDVAQIYELVCRCGDLFGNCAGVFNNPWGLGIGLSYWPDRLQSYTAWRNYFLGID
jgi:hypothetical protein